MVAKAGRVPGILLYSAAISLSILSLSPVLGVGVSIRICCPFAAGRQAQGCREGLAAIPVSWHPCPGNVLQDKTTAMPGNCQDTYVTPHYSGSPMLFDFPTDFLLLSLLEIFFYHPSVVCVCVSRVPLVFDADLAQFCGILLFQTGKCVTGNTSKTIALPLLPSLKRQFTHFT